MPMVLLLIAGCLLVTTAQALSLADLFRGSLNQPASAKPGAVQSTTPAGPAFATGPNPGG